MFRNTMQRFTEDRKQEEQCQHEQAKCCPRLHHEYGEMTQFVNGGREIVPWWQSRCKKGLLPRFEDRLEHD